LGAGNGNGGFIGRRCCPRPAAGQISDVCDLDLIVEGDAVGLAAAFAEKVGGKLTPT